MSLIAAAAPVIEQSALTYTLLEIDNNPITWTEFSLIIRSLHSYKVISIDEDPECKTITVTVAYYANCANARKRLGRAGEFIAVSRESVNIQKEELQALQQLRRKFGFGRNDEDEECPPPKSSKKRRYANSN